MTPIVTLTRENFLRIILAKDQRWDSDTVRRLFSSGEAIDAMFVALATHAHVNGHLFDEKQTSISRPSVSAHLPLMIGHSIHMSLSKAVQKEMKDLTVGVGVLLSIAARQITAEPSAMVAGLAALVPALLRSVSKLRKQLGEICIVEAIHELYDNHSYSGPTAERIAHLLGGEHCRYPGQDCRYETNEVCSLAAPNVLTILAGLQKKEVITPLNHESPTEWKLVL